MDLNDKCYLYVTDGMGVVVWESLFHRGKALQYVESTFTGMSQDPLEWGAGGDDRPPVNAPTIGHPHPLTYIVNILIILIICIALVGIAKGILVIGSRYTDTPSTNTFSAT
jgi:hypothetical protein